MADRAQVAWAPDWAVAPGEVLAEVLEERAMSQAELARRMARPLKTISEIANGKAAVTPETAIQLERALGIRAGFWNGLEVRYREHLARQRASVELAGYADWLAGFPLQAMVRHGLVPLRRAPTERVADVLSFFEVSNPDGWQRQWGSPAAQFRLALSHPSSPQALAAWLRWGQREAATIKMKGFDRATLMSTLAGARGLTRLAAFDIAIGRLQAVLAASGVAVVLLPELPGARVSGASYWLKDDAAVIQLSWRYKSDDHLWFSLFHEIGHLVTGRKRDLHVDDLFGSEERPVVGSEAEADEFARNLLIPLAEYERFLEVGELGHEAVRTFARSLGIAPGIVVGRLQRDRHLAPGGLDILKRHYDIGA